MSLENDPFEDIPEESLEETQPAAPPPPSYLPQYTQPTDVTEPPPSGIPRWALITIGVIVFILLALVCLLFTLLVTQNANRQTLPSPTAVPKPAVQAIPSTVTGGTVATIHGVNFQPDEQVIFYLRDATRPTEPILQIGSTQATPQGTFDWSFIYPSDDRWIGITHASVIVKSSSTGAYFTADLDVTPTGSITPTSAASPTEVPVTVPPQAPTSTFSPPVLATPTQTPDPNAWRAQYFNNPNLQAPPVLVQNDASINFNWGTGSPAPNIPADYFSASWTRTMNFDGGMYRFTARVDDGVRVWLDSNLIIDEWHTASPYPYIQDINVPTGVHTVRVDYFEGVGLAFINFSVDKVVSYPDWKGEYYSNSFLSGAPVYTRDDAAVAFDWGLNAPAPGMPVDNFSVRWSRTASFDGGVYRFSFRVDDGLRFFVDGNLLIDEWHITTNQVYTRDVNLAPGAHTLVVEYYDQTGPASIWLTYQPLVGDASQWSGSYFANNNWYGIPTMVRYDADINFDWGTGSPSPLLPVDNFTVRWTHVISLTAGQYLFEFTVDDGVRFYLDNQLLLDKVLQTAAVTYQVRATVGQSGNHELRIEYVEYSGQASIKFKMTPLNVFVTPTPTPTPTPTLAPPTATFTPTATPTATPATPAILTFTANTASIALSQCVTLAWNTSGVVSPIILQLNGQPLQSNLSAVGTASHCPTTTGQQVYTLLVTSSPNYGPVSAQVTVDVVGPTPTASPTSSP